MCVFQRKHKKLLEIIYFISLSLKAVKKTLYSSVPRRPTKGISDEKFASEDCDTVFSSKNSNSVDLKEYKVFENNDHSKFRGTNLSWFKYSIEWDDQTKFMLALRYFTNKQACNVYSMFHFIDNPGHKLREIVGDKVP